MSKKDSLSQTLAENHGRFLAFLRTRVETKEAAEELLHAAYVKGLEQIDTVRDEERVIAWFYRLLRNALYDYYRRRGAQARAMEKVAQEAAAEQPKDIELEKAICQCVSRVINTLKPEYAEVLKKVELEGSSLKDIASENKAATNAVAVRLHRARQKLKKSLIETCGTCAQHACLDCSCRQV